MIQLGIKSGILFGYKILLCLIAEILKTSTDDLFYFSVMNINTGSKFHLLPLSPKNIFVYFSDIRTYYFQANQLWFGHKYPVMGHLEMEDIMKNKTNNTSSHIGKKLLVLGILTVYLCMATACGNNKNNNNSGSMAASPSPSTSPATQESTVTQTPETGTAATDNMGDTNGNGNTVSENDSMLDNAGNAVGEAGDTVGDIVDDAANGVSDITNDLVGNGQR